MVPNSTALDLLDEYPCSHLPKVSSPLDPSSKLKADTGVPLSDPSIYRRLVGQLNYLTHTRPDLSYAVLRLSQYMQNPTTEHFSAGLRVLRYLHADPGQGVFLNSSSSLDLLAFCDSDWASCPDSRRSVSGFFISLGGSPVTWLSRLLVDLSVPPPLPIPVYSDSQAAIQLARNPVFHERTKHVELDCHFVRQQYAAGLITLSFVPSAHQIADLFTKALSGPSHHRLLSKLGIVSLPSILRGDVNIVTTMSSYPSSFYDDLWYKKKRAKEKAEGLEENLFFTEYSKSKSSTTGNSVSDKYKDKNCLNIDNLTLKE